MKFADEAVCIGPAPSKDSYLNIPNIIAACEITVSDAIHPGYGFLSESAQFSQICQNNGFTFLGPNADIIDSMGNKAKAKRTMKNAGVPVIPGGDGILQDTGCISKGGKNGIPCDVKSFRWRGRSWHEASETVIRGNTGFKSANQETVTSFGNGDIYIEKFIQNPRHIEVQILADSHGNAIHLGERECSIPKKASS